MSQIIEIDEEGVLRLTQEHLGKVGAHARFALEREGDVIVLRPLPGTSRWDSSTPSERAAEFRRWALSHRGGPGLPDKALSRESIYD